MKKLGILALSSVCATVALARCVGDSNINPTDGGTDTTMPQDAATDGLSTDGGTDADVSVPAPKPDGSVAWFEHYNSNALFNDLSAADPSGNIVVAGGLRTCSSCNNTNPDYQTHIGGFALPATPPTVGTDALIAKLNASGSPSWARSLQVVPNDAGVLSFNDDFITSVAVDGNGDIYLAGSTTSYSMTLKDTFLGPASFVAKLSSDGTTYQWDHVYTSTVVAGVYTQTLSVVGTKVAVALSYTGTLTYDSGQSVTSAGGVDVFVADLNTTDGTTVWHQSIGGSADEYVNDLAESPTGDVIIGGRFASTAVSGPGTGFPLTQIGTQINGFVAKLAASNGSGIYALVYGDQASAGQVIVNSVAYGGAGTVAVGGSNSGSSVNFGKGAVSSNNTDGFVLAYDEMTQAAAFVTALVSDQQDQIFGVAVDAWGEVAATGEYAGYGPTTTAQIGSTLLPNTTYRGAGMVVAKWDPTGNILWADPYIPSAADGTATYPVPDAGADSLVSISGSRVRFSPTGKVYVSGGMTGGVIVAPLGYQSHLSTLGPEFSLCFSPPCPPILQPDGVVGAWMP